MRLTEKIKETFANCFAYLKLAPYFQKMKILSRVSFAPAIVLQFLTGFKNSFADLLNSDQLFNKFIFL